MKLCTTKRPITLLINSPGGCASEALAIISAIRMCKYPVEGVVIGMAGSAACDILQVCTRRKATKHSSLFNHAHLGASVYSHERTSRKEFEEAHARVHAVRVSIWRERLNKTEEEISEKILDKDRTISAEQALAEGWIDEVI